MPYVTSKNVCVRLIVGFGTLVPVVAGRALLLYQCLSGVYRCRPMSHRDPGCRFEFSANTLLICVNPYTRPKTSPLTSTTTNFAQLYLSRPPIDCRDDLEMRQLSLVSSQDLESSSNIASSPVLRSPQEQ
jgi:hypothetical protein